MATASKQGFLVSEGSSNQQTLDIYYSEAYLKVITLYQIMMDLLSDAEVLLIAQFGPNPINKCSNVTKQKYLKFVQHFIPAHYMYPYCTSTPYLNGNAQ